MNKSWIMILTGLLFGLLAVGLILLLAQPKQGVPITLMPAPTATATGLPMPTWTPKPILAQIGGAVHSPGVYSLPEGARVEDLILAAGGLSTDADLDRINTIAALQDGDYYYLPAAGQAIPETATNAPSNITSEHDSAFTYPLDLNTATQEELESLPGIGPSKAADILAYRDSHGPFLSLDDLVNVPGIGEVTVDSLRDYLIVD